MYINYKFPVITFLIIWCFGNHTLAEKNVKIWKPNNNILNKKNWVNENPPDECGTVEFADENTATIIIDKLTAKEFIFPSSGELMLLDSGYLEIVNAQSKKKTNCMKLKEIHTHDFLEPENWQSDVSDNLAVPDVEKLPCRFDKVKFPSGIYSGVSLTEFKVIQYVSAIEFGNETLNMEALAEFKKSDLGKAVFKSHPFANHWPDLYVYKNKRKCADSSGCRCNRFHVITCPPQREIKCLSPVDPMGFCNKMCGAFIAFTPSPGFKLNSIENLLKEYSDVDTHVSRVLIDQIQVVFTEKNYGGDSVIYAKRLYETLQKQMRFYKIAKFVGFEISGSETSGDTSLLMVFFLSLMFVLGFFSVLFYVYGDYKIPLGIRFTTAPSLPLSATYRARFSSHDDESGLIFDNQSLAGSVMNLEQSFDNPMYGEVSTEPDINDDVTTKTNAAILVKSVDQGSQGDILHDLDRLNKELKEEMGSDLTPELPNISELNYAYEASPSILELEEDEHAQTQQNENIEDINLHS